MNSSSLIRTRPFLLLLVLTLAASTARSFTVLDYWLMGENDPWASSGVRSTNITDAVGGRNLANSAPNYPCYTNDVAGAAAANTGSRLALQLNDGQFSVGSVIPNLTNNFGIELWVKPANLYAGTQVLAYNGNPNANGCGIVLSSGGYYEAIFGGVIIFDYAPAASGVWTHLALVRAGGIATFYVNGISVGSIAAFPNPPTGNFLLGGTYLGGVNFVGELDEVRVFTFGTGEFNVNQLLYYQTPLFTLGASSFSVAAAAGTNSVSLYVTPENVSWSASANASWLHLAYTNGTGSTNLAFTYDQNLNGTRIGTLTIAGQTVTVTQALATYTVSNNIPTLNFRQKNHTNTLSWVTSGANHTTTLQSTFAPGPNAVWTDVTNAPVVSGATNTITLPVSKNGAQFFRLKVL